MRVFFRTFDHEVRAGKVGGQGACGTQDIKGLFDQGAKLGFHNGQVVIFNGVALYASRRMGLNGESRLIRSHHPARRHRHRRAVADHEMVQQAHIDQGQCLF